MRYLVGEAMTGGYGDADILHDCTIGVDEGEIAVVVGPNGAGKSTAMKAVFGMLGLRSGRVLMNGEDITALKPQERVRKGMGFVPQTNNVFPSLTVLENLEVGAYTRTDDEVQSDIEMWFEKYPVLGERRTQAAGSLSGGEQQMLAVARAAMSRPTMMLLDEPSLGLAPLIIEDLFQTFAQLNKEQGTSMLLVEQNANLALEIADRGYLLETGEITGSGSAEELRNDPAVQAAYLGA